MWYTVHITIFHHNLHTSTLLPHLNIFQPSITSKPSFSQTFTNKISTFKQAPKELFQSVGLENFTRSSLIAGAFAIFHLLNQFNINRSDQKSFSDKKNCDDKNNLGGNGLIFALGVGRKEWMWLDGGNDRPGWRTGLMLCDLGCIRRYVWMMDLSCFYNGKLLVALDWLLGVLWNWIGRICFCLILILDVCKFFPRIEEFENDDSEFEDFLRCFFRGEISKTEGRIWSCYGLERGTYYGFCCRCQSGRC